MSQVITDAIANDLLGGMAQVVPVKESSTGRVLRYLVRSKPAIDILRGADREEYEIQFFSQHTQMCTELISQGYTGTVAFEVPITTLIDCIELYRAIAYSLLSSQMALHLHVVMVDDLPQYTQDTLMVELGELVALGVELIIDNLTTQEHLDVAQMIFSLVEEIRMDLTEKNATAYIHLSALLSSDLSKKRVGVILSNDHDLPTFSTTYQIS